MSVLKVTRKNKVRTARTKSIEVLLRETARKDDPVLENVNNPLIAPQDDDVRQSGRVLELHNRDLWIRLTDLSWHFPEHQRRNQEWSPDEARARSDWQSADWDRSNAQEHYMAITSLQAMRSSILIL